MQTGVSAALSAAPHRVPLPAQRASGPRLLQPRGVRALLGPRLRGRRRRVRTLGRGPKAVVERWAPLALAALPARHLSSLLSAGLPPDRGGASSGSADAAWAPSLRAHGSGTRVPPRSAKLRPPGVRRERWVRRCEGVSVLGMCASDGGTELGDPVRWPPAMGVQMGLPALS